MELRIPNADLSEILAFTQVVRGGSFTAAAKALSMPKSTVSRKIGELETRVGARLLQRTTRSVSLTDVGRAYYERCARVIAELEEAEAVVTRMQASPRGPLRLTVPLNFSVMAPILAEYLSRYPDVQLEVFSSDRRVDLVEERFDLALRAGPPPDSSLVGKRVGIVRKCVLASPAVAERVGILEDPAELRSQPCLVFAPEGSTWSLNYGAQSVEVTVQPRLIANDFELLRALARDGGGLALLPEYQCLDDVAAGRLTRVLPGWSARAVPVYALYPSGRYLSLKVTALLELLKERLELTWPGASG
jgi:DNA-binding transcriptional LysR family regulator